MAGRENLYIMSCFLGCMMCCTLVRVVRGLVAPCRLKETAVVLKELLVNGSCRVLLVMNCSLGLCWCLISSTLREKLYGMMLVFEVFRGMSEALAFVVRLTTCLFGSGWTVPMIVCC